MKNRAKCKLCNTIVESKHRHDYTTCACGEISVDGGDDYWRCVANDPNNFIRLNDDDTIWIPPTKVEEIPVKEIVQPKPTKKELIQLLEDMAKRIEELPDRKSVV